MLEGAISQGQVKEGISGIYPVGCINKYQVFCNGKGTSELTSTVAIRKSIYCTYPLVEAGLLRRSANYYENRIFIV